MDPKPPTTMQYNLARFSVSSDDSYYLHQAVHPGIVGNGLRTDYMRDGEMEDMVLRELQRKRIRDEIEDIVEREVARKCAYRAEIERALLEREFAIRRLDRCLPRAPSSSSSSPSMHYQNGGYGSRINEEIPHSSDLVEPGACNRLIFQRPLETAIPAVNVPFRHNHPGLLSEVKTPFQHQQEIAELQDTSASQPATEKMLVQHPKEDTMPKANSIPQERAAPKADAIPQAAPGKLLLLPKPMNPSLSRIKRAAEEAAEAEPKPKIPNLSRIKTGEVEEAAATEPSPMNPNLSEIKRSKEEPSAAGQQSKAPKAVKKKDKKPQSQEWTCELCQINTTSDKGLQDHFKGKKHKAKATKLQKGDLPKQKGL